MSNGNQVAVLRIGQRYFLPGGGAEPGESLEETLRREILEECGRAVEIVRPLGFAIEYVVADGEGYFAKQCSFFEARLGEREAQPTETDHELTWLPISDALFSKAIPGRSSVSLDSRKRRQTK